MNASETGRAPAYGMSDHYLGEKGADYFQWQSAGGEFAAKIHKPRFAPWISPTDTVLDFGCGGGFLLHELDCARRIGVDINPLAVEHAKNYGVEGHTALATVENEVADVVISNHALEHVSHPIACLKEIYTKLKPSGRLVLCVPIDNWRRQRHYDPNNRDHHLNTWTPQLLGNTLQEAGYEIQQIDALQHAWPGNWTVACYSRLPRWGFDAVCFTYSVFTGKGQQVLAIARRPG